MTAEAAPREGGGLDRVRELVAGTRPLPGMWRTLGLRPVAADVGHATVEVAAGERHHNGSGMIHGGLVAALVDSATGMAMVTELGPHRRVSTVDLHVDYLRPAPAAGTRLVAEATVVHLGSSIGHAAAVITTAAGRRIATGRAIFAITAAPADSEGVLNE